MELKIGMYVRDNYRGIGVVTGICHCEQCNERGFYEPIIDYREGQTYVRTYNEMQDYEGRADFNILKILKKGDFINGRCVESVSDEFIELESYSYDDYGDNYLLENKDIQTIITKEQFESTWYKVGEPNESN